MMPLTVAPIGEKTEIKKVGGNPALKQHLADLGFVTGGDVTVIAENGGSLIVSVKDVRIALGKDMAMRIMV
ncbi:MAG: ferrous iron transport protein A [Solobacterium sp.]|nr:ferrous iron transport protein A [Solobacterium sp.]